MFESFWYRKANTSQPTSKQSESEKQEAAVGSALFRWLVKLKDIVLSKFTLYYYNQLSTQVCSKDIMRSIYDDSISKLTNGINFVRKLENFQKKIALKDRNRDIFTSFFLICEESIDITTNENGYNHPISNTQMQEETPMAHHFLFVSSCKLFRCDMTTEDLKKERNVEPSLSFSIDGQLDSTERKIDLENISCQLQEEPCWTNLARPNQIVHFDCKTKDERYFLLRSEPQIVVGFKISNSGFAKWNTTGQSNLYWSLSYIQDISQFLHEIARDTRCNNVFASLKGASVSN